MSHKIAESLDSAEKRLRPAIVAIPARDEAERIEACLTALSDQQHCPDAVVLLLNNCTDGTEHIARALAPRLRYRLDIVSRELPPRQANAGWARRLAMQLAAARAGAGGVLMATDADTVVPPDWVARNLAALDRGADVVCGRAVVDPWEAAMIPAHLHADDALECRLIALLDDIAWMSDPEPHDPPPRHTEASGASLAVSAGAYLRVGGIPAIPCGEDRAFVASLWRMDARVRHDPGINVVVSGRIEGRAEGGMADAIRRRMVQQDEYADEQAEPARDAARRYSLRSRVRQAWLSRRADSGLAAALEIPFGQVFGAVSGPFFGAAWAELERLSPVLRRRRVRFAELSREIERAEDLLRRLTPADAMAAD
jgi:hypothetical protein